MEQEFQVSKEYIAILRRYKQRIFLISLAGLILSSLIAIKLPHMYKSTATILIDQTGHDGIVKSIVTNYAEQRIQVINQKIMSSESLKNIIDKFNLYQKERDNISIYSIVDAISIVNKMRENTHMEILRGDPVLNPKSGNLIMPTIGFTLSFDSKSPEVSQQIASELVSLYLNANINQRAKVVEEANKFLQQETTKLRDEIYMLEAKLAKFKAVNSANLPGLNQVNLNRVDRIEQKIVDANTNIRSLTDRVFQLRIQLSQLDSHTTTYSSTGQRIYGVDDRLTILQAEYAALSSKYSEGHPDLVKMRREISSLQKETGQSLNTEEYQIQLHNKQSDLAVLMDRYSVNHPDVKRLKMEISNLKDEISQQPVEIKKKGIERQPNNPAYIQLQSELIATEAELNSLKISRRYLEDKLSTYEESLSKAPEVEREYKLLMRDYENATRKYNEVKAKQMEASMARSMEKSTKGDEFLLLEAPLVPENPFEPNRKAIAFLGLLASIGAALGSVVVKESLQPSIYTAGRLASVTGIPPLVSIPYIRSEKYLLKRQKIIKIISLVVVVLVVSIFIYRVTTGL